MENSNKFKGYLDMYSKIINHRAWRSFLALFVLVLGMGQNVFAGPDATITRALIIEDNSGNTNTQVSVPDSSGNLTTVDKAPNSCTVTSTKLAGSPCCINAKESPLKACAPVNSNKQCPTTDYLSDSSGLCGDDCTKLSDPAYILAKVTDDQNRPNNFDFYMSPNRSCASRGGTLVDPRSCKVPCTPGAPVEFIANTSISKWSTWDGCDSGSVATGECFKKCPASLGSEAQITAKFLTPPPVCPSLPFAPSSGTTCCAGTYCAKTGQCQNTSCGASTTPSSPSCPSLPHRPSSGTSCCNGKYCPSTGYCQNTTCGTTPPNTACNCKTVGQNNCQARTDNLSCQSGQEQCGTGQVARCDAPAPPPPNNCAAIGEFLATGQTCCNPTKTETCVGACVAKDSCCAGEGKPAATYNNRCCPDQRLSLCSSGLCSSNCAGGGCKANGVAKGSGTCCSNVDCNGICSATACNNNAVYCCRKLGISNNNANCKARPEMACLGDGYCQFQTSTCVN